MAETQDNETHAETSEQLLLKTYALDGHGSYTFASGVEYVGTFQDGDFHGNGTLTFPNRGVFKGTWSRGRLVSGDYFFDDNLPYQAQDWSYCTLADRRFHNELERGVAAEPQLTNAQPTLKIPPTMYDVGDGYLDVSKQKVYTYDHHELRDAASWEGAWAAEKCRVGTV